MALPQRLNISDRHPTVCALQAHDFTKRTMGAMLAAEMELIVTHACREREREVERYRER